MSTSAEDIAVLGLELDSRPIVDGAKQVEGALGRTSKAAGALERDMQSLWKVTAGVFGAMAGFRFAQWIKGSIDLAARYETLGVVLTRVGSGAGYNQMQLDNMTKALQTTGISALQARQSIISMIQANIDLSKSTQLARVAQDAAVTAGLNSSETLQRIIHGITAGQTEVLRTVGLQVNFHRGYQQMAKTLGTTVEGLTSAQKAQARMNATMDAAKFIAGSYEAAMGTAGKQIKSTERYVEDLRVKLGTLALGAYTQSVFAYSNSLKFLSANFNGVAAAATAMATMAIGKGLRPLGAAIVETNNYQRQQILGAAMARDAELAAAQAQMVRVDAMVAEKTSMVALASVNAANLAETGSAAVATAALAAAQAEQALAANVAVAAEARLVAANAAMTASAIIATGAVTLLKGALAFFGGPIGIAIMAVAVAFGVMQYNAYKAAENVAKVRQEYAELTREQIQSRSRLLQAEANTQQSNIANLRANPYKGESISEANAQAQKILQAQETLADIREKQHELYVAARNLAKGQNPGGPPDDTLEIEAQVKALKNMKDHVKDLMFEAGQHTQLEGFHHQNEKLKDDFDELAKKMKLGKDEINAFYASLRRLEEQQARNAIDTDARDMREETQAIRDRARATAEGALALAKFNKEQAVREYVRNYSRTVSADPFDTGLAETRFRLQQGAAQGEAIAKANAALDEQTQLANAATAARRRGVAVEAEMEQRQRMEAAMIEDINAGITDPAALAALQRRREAMEASAAAAQREVTSREAAQAHQEQRVAEAKKMGQDLRSGMEDSMRGFWTQFFRDGHASMKNFFEDLGASIAGMAGNKVASSVMSGLYTMTQSRNGLLRGGINSQGGLTGFLQNHGMSDAMIQNLGKGAMGGLAGAGVGFGLGAGIYQATGSGTQGAFAGAAGGAAAGFMVGGPVGAAVGALAGLATGIMGARSAARAAREEMVRLQTAFQANLVSMRALVGTATPLEDALSKTHAQFVQMREEAQKAYAGRKNESEREKILRELDSLEAKRTEQLRNEAAMLKVHYTEDLQVRLLRAQGKTREAERLQLQHEQQREYEEAVKNKTDDATLALLKQVQAQEALKAATDAANASALNLVSGYKLAHAVFTAMDTGGPPGTNPAAAAGVGADGPMTVQLNVDGRAIAKVVVSNLQRSAQAQFGDTTRWGEVTAV